MRAPFQILAIPYKKEKELLYCIFHRADNDQWQFIAGGGEDSETPKEAAIRERYEEAGIENADVLELVSRAYVPANVIKECHRKYWPKDTYVLPEYQYKGIGKELVQRCINACKTSEWLVQTDTARGFYEKIGFKENADYFLTIPCKWF